MSVYSKALVDVYLQTYTDADFDLFIISVFFICFYYTLKFGSFIVACTSICVVLLAIPITQIVNQQLFGITYFSGLFVFVFFIVLNVATTNLFFIHDQWMRAQLIPGINTLERLTFTVRKCIPVNAMSSIVLGLGFYTSLISELMPIRDIGLFAGTLMIVSFILISVTFPCILSVYELYLKEISCLRGGLVGCLKCCKGNSTFIDMALKDAIIEHDKDASLPLNEQAAQKRSRDINEFFRNKLNFFSRKFRWAIIGLSVSWFIIALNIIT